MKFPTIEEMARDVAEKALDEYEYNGKTLRQWIEIILATASEDTISRQAAIDAFNTNIDELVVAGKENADAVERYLNRVIDEIKQLPPIQPKKGRWIGKYPVSSICSECGYLINDSKVKVFAFCPNCGAKMEEKT